MTNVARGAFDGVMNIVRFNWPFFVTSGVLALISAVIALRATDLRVVWMSTFTVTLVVVGTIVSLAVSHVIYDRSDLYRLTWIDRALRGMNVRHVTFCQTGFDETSTLLGARLGASSMRILDHYDPSRMTEASIRRARRYCPPIAGSEAAPFDEWPVPSASTDVVIAMLSIHELRSDTERTQWFTEARRTLRPDGRVIIVEHVRDLANLLAFGPGFLHFHSVSSWRHTWQQAQLHLRDEFRITPWVRVFVLEQRNTLTDTQSA